MALQIGVISFPGSHNDADLRHALDLHPGLLARRLRWDQPTLGQVDAVMLPGGFAHGDLPRPGLQAAEAPVMAALRTFARGGGLVVGICNGWQILCEAGLLPGRLEENAQRRFVCDRVRVKVGGRPTALTRGLEGEELRLPVAHRHGRYCAEAEELRRLEGEGQVVLSYLGASPNGGAVAGICNAGGNVIGLMPHPERAMGPQLGGADGRRLLAALAGEGAWAA